MKETIKVQIKTEQDIKIRVVEIEKETVTATLFTRPRKKYISLTKIEKHLIDNALISRGNYFSVIND